MLLMATQFILVLSAMKTTLTSITYMTRVEGENSRFRQQLARLHRKTFCYSKSEEMLKLSIRLVIQQPGTVRWRCERVAPASLRRSPNSYFDSATPQKLHIKFLRGKNLILQSKCRYAYGDHHKNSNKLSGLIFIN